MSWHCLSFCRERGSRHRAADDRQPADTADFTLLERILDNAIHTAGQARERQLSELEASITPSKDLPLPGSILSIYA